MGNKFKHTVHKSSALNLTSKSKRNTLTLQYLTHTHTHKKKHSGELDSETNSVIFCGLPVFLFAWSPVCRWVLLLRASCRNRQPRPLLRAISTELPTFNNQVPRFELSIPFKGCSVFLIPKKHLRITIFTSQRKI